MKKTYTSTAVIGNLEDATIMIYLSNAEKYKPHKIDKIVKYTGLVSWDIIEGGEEAKEIEMQGLMDEHHEYLVLHFNDGTDATFRNSHVDMFIR